MVHTILIFFLLVLKAQLYNYIDVTDSLTILAISSFFVDRFGRSLRFYHQEFDKEAISDG